MWRIAANPVGLQPRAKGMTERHTAAASVDGSKDRASPKAPAARGRALGDGGGPRVHPLRHGEHGALPPARPRRARGRRARDATRGGFEHKLIIEGDLGDKLYLVEEGIFDVLSRRNGVDVKVNSKSRGDIFGEISSSGVPENSHGRSASRGAVWVLDRARFRALTRKAAVESNSERGVLNSRPGVRRSRRHAAQPRRGARRAQVRPGQVVARGGYANADTFYLVVRGEAIVTVREKDALASGETVGASGEVGGASGEGSRRPAKAPKTSVSSPNDGGGDARTGARRATRRGEGDRRWDGEGGESSLPRGFSANALSSRRCATTVTAAGTAPLCVCASTGTTSPNSSGRCRTGWREKNRRRWWRGE